MKGKMIEKKKQKEERKKGRKEERKNGRNKEQKKEKESFDVRISSHFPYWRRPARAEDRLSTSRFMTRESC